MRRVTRASPAQRCIVMCDWEGNHAQNQGDPQACREVDMEVSSANTASVIWRCLPHAACVNLDLPTTALAAAWPPLCGKE